MSVRYASVSVCNGDPSRQISSMNRLDRASAVAADGGGLGAIASMTSGRGGFRQAGLVERGNSW